MALEMRNYFAFIVMVSSTPILMHLIANIDLAQIEVLKDRKALFTVALPRPAR